MRVWETWRRQWIFMATFLFAGSFVLLRLFGDPHPLARAAFIAAGASSFVALPGFLASRVRLADGSRGSRGFTSRGQCWLFWICLMEAFGGLVLILALPS